MTFYGGSEENNVTFCGGWDPTKSKTTKKAKEKMASR
jgi:hypothetical protein